MLGYLSADIICSERRTVFRERSSRKTVTFEEQIMSKDKYPSIFSQPNWGYCVYYPSVLKIGEYPRIFPSFSWGIFSHVTRLDQSRVSENIWWIIIIVIILLPQGICNQVFLQQCLISPSHPKRSPRNFKFAVLEIKQKVKPPFGDLVTMISRQQVNLPEGIGTPKTGKQIKSFPLTLTARHYQHMLNVQAKCKASK